MARRGVCLTDAQWWAKIELLLPRMLRSQRGGRPWASEPLGCRRRYFVGAEDGGSMARPARGVSESVDVLASPEALGRGRDVAPNLAHDYRGAGRTWPVAAGNRVHRRHLCPGEKGGSDISPTKRHLRVAARRCMPSKGGWASRSTMWSAPAPAHSKEQRAKYASCVRDDTFERR